MKKLKFQKTLSFEKEVVTRLNDDEMDGVKGGLLSITRHCSHVHEGCGSNATQPLFCNSTEPKPEPGSPTGPNA